MANERRSFIRVAGPFNGHRVVSSIETPVRIHDLNEGGCFVTSMHAAPSVAGRPIVLKIQVPNVGWIDITGEVLYAKPPFGYAVRFTDTAPKVSGRLERALTALRAAAAS
jgi:hypothetical protein